MECHGDMHQWLGSAIAERVERGAPTGCHEPSPWWHLDLQAKVKDSEQKFLLA